MREVSVITNIINILYLFLLGYVTIILNWYKKYVNLKVLEAYGYDEAFLDEKIKKLIFAVRINRVINEKPEKQVETKQQLWTFTIVKR